MARQVVVPKNKNSFLIQDSFKDRQVAAFSDYRTTKDGEIECCGEFLGLVECGCYELDQTPRYDRRSKKENEPECSTSISCQYQPIPLVKSSGDLPSNTAAGLRPVVDDCYSGDADAKYPVLSARGDYDSDHGKFLLVSSLDLDRADPFI